jgi:hypothetical protein
MHIVIVEALLIAIYLEGKNAYMHIRPTLMPEAALPPGACPAEPSAISVQLNLYEPASSNRNAAYSQQHLAVHGLGLRKLVGQGLVEDIRSNEGEAALHFSRLVCAPASSNHTTTLETRSCS